MTPLGPSARVAVTGASGFIGRDVVRDLERRGRYRVAPALNGRDNGIVNICSGSPTQVVDLVRRAVAARGSSIALNLGRSPYPQHEPMAFWGDPTKLEQCLGAVSEPRV